MDAEKTRSAADSEDRQQVADTGTVPSHARRQRRLRSAVVALITLVLAPAAMAANAPTVGAASAPGPSYPAEVWCNSFDNSLILSAAAGPQAGKTSQRIYYRFWIHDDTANVWVQGWGPSTWGSWVSRPSGMAYDRPADLKVYLSAPSDHYVSIWTEYMWDTGATSGYKQTTLFHQIPINAFQYYCKV